MIRATALCLAVLLVVACRGPEPADDLLAGRELVDLTHPFGSDTIYWPTAATGFEHAELHRGRVAAGFYYSAYAFAAPEHGGTHLDAPSHFAEGAPTADRIALERLIGPALVIDVERACAADPDHAVTAAEIEAWEGVHGRVAAGSIVLLRTGWGARWPDRRAYLGDDRPGRVDALHFPGYSAGAARLLVDREVALVGIDTASLDAGPSTGFEAHVVFAAAGIAGLENIAHLDRLPPTGAWVIALPMKIEGGSGGPARIVALVPAS